MKHALAALVVSASTLSTLWATDTLPYRSPFDLAFSPDGKTLALSDRTAGCVYLIDVDGRSVREAVELEGQPTGVVWSGQADGATLLVAEYDAGSVAQIDPNGAKVRRRLKVGLRPVGLAVAPGRRLLLAANGVTDDVSIVDLEGGEEKARIRVPREPYFIAVTPDESLAVVGNLLPRGSASDPSLAAVISLLDLEPARCVANIKLPAGSTAVHEVAVSPDGRWAYVVHTLGRFNVPTTQLDRGWVNTNALSIIDLSARALYTTVLLDHPFEGATDPWGLALTGGGQTLWISLRGVHEVARVDLAGLHRLLEGELPPSLAAASGSSGVAYTVWSDIQRDPTRRDSLMNDLSALHVAGLIEKLSLDCRGPRGIDLSPDGELLAVAGYYSGNVVLLDTRSEKTVSTVSLGPSREPDVARQGEALFHDATICFQRWLSCSTCHPDNGRTDGLRWDLLNDGLGTPQRTRSLLLSHKIAPTTARGVRANLEVSVKKGMFFFSHPPDPDVTEPLIAYLRSLEPEPSPYLVDGELSPSARRGEALFRGKANCVRCHEGELGTDLEAHNVGTRGKFDREDDVFYTPKLVELYRTAPFLHDGRAATLEGVFRLHDPDGKHGDASELDERELEDLIEYLKSR